MTARARHDQPVSELVDPDEIVVRCENSNCRRPVRVVAVPGASQFRCPFCDSLLRVDLDGGAR